MTEQAALFSETDVICPCCGGVEPNRYLLSINHGYEPGQKRYQHPVYGEKCVAQWLVSNHISQEAKRGELMPITITRGKDLGLDTEQIIREATAE